MYFTAAGSRHLVFFSFSVLVLRLSSSSSILVVCLMSFFVLSSYSSSLSSLVGVRVVAAHTENTTANAEIVIAHTEASMSYAEAATDHTEVLEYCTVAV